MSSKTKNKTQEPTKSSRPKIWVVGGGMDYIKLFYDLGCDGAKNLDDADVVLFTGGADVTPDLYNEPCMPKTNFDRLRDQKEQAIYEAAKTLEIPMVGICRGGQFLNVMNGGSMFQHVTGHAMPGTHLARIEIPPYGGRDKSIRRTINVTSTHHQMMRPTEEAIVLMTAQCSYERHTPGKTYIGKADDDHPDIEAVFYDETNCLCFQPHPEVARAPAELVDFFEECLDNFIFPRINVSTPKKVLNEVEQAIKALDRPKLTAVKGGKK